MQAIHHLPQPTVWLVIGLVFYFGYGRKHSRLEAAGQAAFR